MRRTAFLLAAAVSLNMFANTVRVEVESPERVFQAELVSDQDMSIGEIFMRGVTDQPCKGTYKIIMSMFVGAAIDITFPFEDSCYAMSGSIVMNSSDMQTLNSREAIEAIYRTSGDGQISPMVIKIADIVSDGDSNPIFAR